MRSPPASLLSVLTSARIALVPIVMGLILLGPDRDYAYPVAAVLSRSPPAPTSSTASWPAAGR
jgi:hypothetical protein